MDIFREQFEVEKIANGVITKHFKFKATRFYNPLKSSHRNIKKIKINVEQFQKC